jgi:hypothetical protein
VQEKIILSIYYSLSIIVYDNLSYAYQICTLEVPSYYGLGAFWWCQESAVPHCCNPHVDAHNCNASAVRRGSCVMPIVGPCKPY